MFPLPLAEKNAARPWGRPPYRKQGVTTQGSDVGSGTADGRPGGRTTAE